MTDPIRMKALLVEDDEEAAMLLRADLDHDDNPVRFEWRGAVGSLKEALEEVAEGGIDVVLLDLDLPDSTGVATLRAVRKAAPGLPIVVLEEDDALEAALAGVREGAQDILVKDAEPVACMARRIALAVERSQQLVAGQEEAPGMDLRSGLVARSQV